MKQGNQLTLLVACTCERRYVIHLNVPLDYSAGKSQMFREGFLHKQPKMDSVI